MQESEIYPRHGTAKAHRSPGDDRLRLALVPMRLASCRLAVVPSMLTVLVACGSCTATSPRHGKEEPSGRAAAASSPSPPKELALSFSERFNNVPAGSKSNWLISQLRRNRFAKGALTPPWPHFESQCDAHLKFTPPRDSAFPKKKERRPGNKYAPKIDQQSTSSLQWSYEAGQLPTFSLDRSIAAGARERYFRQGKTLWTQRPPEAWSQRPVDDDFHLRWIWEHRQCVPELLELAGPALHLQPLQSPSPGQLSFALSLKEGPAPVVARHTSEPRRAWRANARVLSLSGQLTLDALSGAWIFAKLQVRLSVSPPKGSPFDGEASLEAKTRILSAGQMSWPTPSPAVPLPGPPRYHHEQKTMLQGLAPGGAGGLGSLR